MSLEAIDMKSYIIRRMDLLLERVERDLTLQSITQKQVKANREGAKKSSAEDGIR